MNDIRVYVASPYTLGDVAVNVKTQIDVGIKLLDLGYIPFIPLLCHFLHLIHPRPYETWTRYDDSWIEVCNVLLRLRGESRGADREVKLARQNNIPVVFSVRELCEKFPTIINKEPQNEQHKQI